MVGYAALACLCAAAWHKARHHGQRAEARWWGLMAAGHVFLAVDAALGIRLTLAETGREYFARHGWYGQRWPVQCVLSAAAFMVVILGAVVLRRARKLPAGIPLAASGMLLSLLVFSIAAVSMHWLESLLAWPFEPLALGTSLRTIACGLTALGAWRSLRPHTREHPYAATVTDPSEER